MRENIGLYKAKRKDNGEWVYGCMQFDSLRKIYWIVEEVDDSYYNGVENVEQRAFNEYEIDPETLCECTGLKDKNGKLIFENDKLLVRYGCEQMDISEGTYEHFVKYEKTGHGSQIGFLNGLPCTGYLEVIGNKFDNKELLGE